MRADRLLSMLMLLQSRGKVTAQELAAELEVSERTIHRDVLALCTAGVPVFAERGPGGGIGLVERYRSDLTGLTKDEVHALFMMSIPPALTDLGLDRELRAAMLKLSASLPSSLREAEQGIRQRIHLDPTPREEQLSTGLNPDLQILQDALWESKVLDIRHKSWLRPDLGAMQTIIHPYGLVAKSGYWYLVGKRGDHIGVLRVDLIMEVKALTGTFERPDDFDLILFWNSYREGELRNRPNYPVKVRVVADTLSWVIWSLGEKVQTNLPEGQSLEGKEQVTVELMFEFFEQALNGLLKLGGAVEVLEPLALRYSIKDYAEQIFGVYV